MTEKGKYCSNVMKKHFNKGLVINKEGNENFNNSTKFGYNDYIDNVVKVRDYYHITGKYRGSAHIEFNINRRINYKIPVVPHNLKNHDSHLIVQELSKLNLNGLEQYTSLTINDKLSFIESFQFLSSSLDISVKNSNNDDFKYLSQDFDKNKLDLVKEKGFYFHEYMSDFEKFRKQLPSKEKFYSFLTGKKINDK